MQLVPVASLGLLELCVFRFGGEQNRDVRVGVFPEREEILVGLASFIRFAGQSVGPCKAQLRKRMYWLAHEKSWTIHDAFEFSYSIFSVAEAQISLSSEMGCLNCGYAVRDRAPLIGASGFQQLDGARTVAHTDLYSGMDGRQIQSMQYSVIRRPDIEVTNKSLGCFRVIAPCDGKGRERYYARTLAYGNGG